MIVETADLSRYQRAVAMVDGGFDPLHPGHVMYFQAAATLGVPVLCNITSDEYVARKHTPLLAQRERALLLDAIRYLDLVHCSSTTTAAVLGLLEPQFYVKGVDWRGRLPEEEMAVCASRGIEVVYLDTVLDSSTSILERYAQGTEDRRGS